MLRGVAGVDYAFQNGSEQDTTDEIGKDLVRAGYAVEIKTIETATTRSVETTKANKKK